ncbi:MAG: acetyl-coenzyme A synthetase N-terminal domain-containing protein, partial [Gammaproteobacteria bacterium]
MSEAARKAGRAFPDYAALHRWSVAEKEQFWSLLWDFTGVVGDKGNTVLVDGDDLERARWFPEARVNLA